MNQIGKTAFLFPGQGAQSVGMGRELAQSFPTARRIFEEADDVLGFSLSTLCFSGPEEQLRLTEFTQPAIFTVSIAAQRVLAERGIVPHYAAGHSLGEYSANVASRVLSFADALRIVRRRGQLMQQAVPDGTGAMAAILGMSPEAVAELCRDAAAETNAVVVAANINSPEQTVVSGAAAAVERASALAKDRGAKRAVMLQVSAPFHCPLMQPAENALAPLLEAVPFADAAFPIVVNVDAAPLSNGAELRQALIRQVTGAVRWAESMQWMLSNGVTNFIEVGPGRVLSGLLRQIDRSKKAAHYEEFLNGEKSLG